MQNYQSAYLEALSVKGLNLHAIFDITTLPLDIKTKLAEHCQQLNNYRQLILIGHGGCNLWETLKQTRSDNDNPIDNFTIDAVNHFFSEQLSNPRFEILYPGAHLVDLQKLGEMAGWHHPSPFWVGINNTWGTWYAYRAVVLADTDFTPTAQVESQSPCNSCETKPCTNTCPGDAVSLDSFDIKKCITYRKQTNSKCREQCLARISCPSGYEHRYSKAQINYHYSISMKTIESKY